MPLTKNEFVKHITFDPDFIAGCNYRNALIRRGQRGTEFNIVKYAVFILTKMNEYFETDFRVMETQVQLNIFWYTHFIELLELQSWCTGKM